MNDKWNKWVAINVAIWNVGLILLSAFCCWYFKAMWGIIPLFLVKGIEYTNDAKDIKVTDKEVNNK